MACQPLVIDGKAVGIMCGPRRRKLPCSATGCPNDRLYLCDFELAGAKKGKTCSRGVCEAHRGRACSATSENCGWRAVTIGRQCPACGEPLQKADFCPAHTPYDAVKALCELLDERGIHPTFDAMRNITHQCVFCRGRDVRLVTLGHYVNGLEFTRPVCDPCAVAAAVLQRKSS